MELKLYMFDTCPYCQKVINEIEASGRTDIEYHNIHKNEEDRQELIRVGGKQQVSCQTIATWITPVDLVIIIALYVQFIVLGYMILSKKSGLSRWYILVSPVGAILLGVLWALIFKGTAVEGTWGACESLGEGLIYLTAWIYWKKHK